MTVAIPIALPHLQVLCLKGGFQTLKTIPKCTKDHDLTIVVDSVLHILKDTFGHKGSTQGLH